MNGVKQQQNLIKRGRAICLFLLLFSCSALHAQVTVISPKKDAVIQKVDTGGTFRLIAEAPSPSTTFEFALRNYDASFLHSFEWKSVSVKNGRVDTILRNIPYKQGPFIFQWRTKGVAEDSGIVLGLQVGHVFAIAGQSNAAGYSPPINAPRECDMRMYLDGDSWVPAKDPTGIGTYGSPWVDFGNYFATHLNDGLPVGIINVAKWGSGLLWNAGDGIWTRNKDNPYDANSVYGQALTRLVAAGSFFEGFFWIQGETEGLYWDDIDAYTTDNLTTYYKAAYQQLLANLENDLGSKLKSFHLQISGAEYSKRSYTFGRVREAQRDLPNSTLVGTALGMPLHDGIHFEAITSITIGKLFAGSVLRTLYGIKTEACNLFQPGTLYLTVPDAGDSYQGLLKIRFHGTRNGMFQKFSAPNGVSGFFIRKNGKVIDSSEIVAMIDPHDSTAIDIYTKKTGLFKSDEITLSYAAGANPSTPGITDGDSTLGLPNPLVSFMDLPIDNSLLVGVSGHPPAIQLLANPVRSDLHFQLQNLKGERVEVIVQNILGETIYHSTQLVMTSAQEVTAHLNGAQSGVYFLAVFGESFTGRSKFVVTGE